MFGREEKEGGDEGADKSEKKEKSEEGADSNSTKDGNATGNATSLASYKKFEGAYGFDEHENIENHPVYKKEMDKVLGKTKKMKNRGYGSYGYYGNGGQGSDKFDGAQMDVFEDLESENDKEKEGIYPSEDEEEDEMFIHDLHRKGYHGYKNNDYGYYVNAYGK